MRCILFQLLERGRNTVARDSLSLNLTSRAQQKNAFSLIRRRSKYSSRPHRFLSTSQTLPNPDHETFRRHLRLTLPFVSLALPAAAALLVERQMPKTRYHIHPGREKAKCIGVLDGKFVVASPVDIYDCNGSATQKWAWWDHPVPVQSPLFVTNPADNSRLCMDITDLDTSGNGTKLVLKPCQGQENHPDPISLFPSGRASTCPATSSPP